MALDVLAHGRLVKAPERRTRASGKPFATAQIAVATDGDESPLVSLIAFRREVVTALLALDVGDSVALGGRAKLNAWADRSSGEPRASLSVVVEQVLTAYHVRHKRETFSDARERPVSDDRAPDDSQPVRGADRAPAARSPSLPAVIGRINALADDPLP
ncbi:MAG: hypothetical protein BroJett031_35740 [Betaproteobacteria bacterium]|nr:MAG: hypothetical protein BroJett031_35740 [Betaproteobacteria bacterium]